MPIKLTSWQTHTDVFNPNQKLKTLEIREFMLKLYQKDKITTFIEIVIGGHILLNHKEDIPDEDIAKLTAYNLFKQYLKDIDQTVKQISCHTTDTHKLNITPPLELKVETLPHHLGYHINIYLIDMNKNLAEIISFHSNCYNSLNVYLQIVRIIKNYVKTIQDAFKQTIIAVLTKPAVQQPTNA